MKSLYTAGLSALLFLSGSAYALDPVPGLYAGVFIGPSFTSNAKVNFFHPGTFDPITYDTGPAVGKLNYSILGDAGLEVGYRFNQFRVEGELLYNQSPYRKFTIGGFQLTSSKTTALRFSGYTRTAALMFNAIFDAYSLFENTCYVPYVGVGVGYANIQNSVKLYYKNIVVPESNLSDHQNGGAGQFILGLNYFLDDFTTLGLDYRYFASKTVYPLTTRTAFNAINFSVTGAFDLG